MNIVRIPKRSGEYRTIVVPSNEERIYLRSLLRRLAPAERRLAVARGVDCVAHGFIAGRSPVTNAWLHVGYAVSVSMDLASWFDSVRQEQVAAALEAAGEDPALADRVCWRGHPAQGLPTSPTAANLAAIAMDRDIIDALATLSCAARYTRYADDMTISLQTTDESVVRAVIEQVRRVVERQQWTIRQDKTLIQWARAGRRVITGVAVGPREIAVPRRVRRRLRAAEHRHAGSGACRGLREWCRLRLPAAARPVRRYDGGQILVLSGTPSDKESPELSVRSIPPAVDGGRQYRLL